jgi:hypothetical protein
MAEVKMTSSATFGGNPYAKPWDDLPLPGEGRTIGNTDDISLRRTFAKMQIPEAWTAGRDILCERYRQTLAKIGNSTSDQSIIDWLEQHKD